MIEKNDNPKISVIVPVYKVEPFLSRCLDSVVAQTFSDWECILIDDGSPDNSGAICDEYAVKDRRFKVIHQKNAGVSAARNAGLNVAVGEWICFADSDDWLEKDYLRCMIDATSKSNCELIICGFFQQEADGQVCVKNPRDKKDDQVIHNKEEFLSFFLNLRNIPDYSCYLNVIFNKLYKADLLKNMYFDTSMKIYEDYIFNLDAYDKADNVCLLKENLYNNFYNEKSVTRDKTRLITEQDLSDRKKYICDTLEFAKKNNINENHLLGFCKNVLFSSIIDVSRFYAQHKELSDTKQYNFIKPFAKWNVIFYNPQQWKSTLFLMLFKIGLCRSVLISLTKFFAGR